MERPKQKPTTKLKTKVKELSEVGNQHDENALTLETTDKVGHKCRPKKFDFEKAGADKEVMQALFEMATSGKNTTAAIFWAKARCGMHEKGREKKQQVSQAPTIVIRTEEGKKA